MYMFLYTINSTNLVKITSEVVRNKRCLLIFSLIEQYLGIPISQFKMYHCFKFENNFVYKLIFTFILDFFIHVLYTDVLTLIVIYIIRNFRYSGPVNYGTE